MIFDSQIWSSIYQWNVAKFLHGLYSDFDAYVSRKNELHLTVSLLKFVFWKEWSTFLQVVVLYWTEAFHLIETT